MKAIYINRSRSSDKIFFSSNAQTGLQLGELKDLIEDYKNGSTTCVVSVESLESARDALEDGEYLDTISISDDYQDAVEELHSHILKAIKRAECYRSIQDDES